MINQTRIRPFLLGTVDGRRRGSVAVELLLVMPILLGLIFGVVEIGLMTSVNEQMAAASREGCRVAALGGNVREIARAVYNRLGGGSLCQAQIVAVLEQDSKGNPLPIVITLDENGNPVVSSQSNEKGRPIPHGDPIMVRVQIAAGNAVPDLMTIIGISIRNHMLVGQTIMRKE